MVGARDKHTVQVEFYLEIGLIPGTIVLHRELHSFIYFLIINFRGVLGLCEETTFEKYLN